MAVKIRLSGSSKKEVEDAVKALGAAFSPTSPVRAGRKGDFLCYGVYIAPAIKRARKLAENSDGRRQASRLNSSSDI